MKECQVCGNPKSHYRLNQRRVCLTCDELLFDIEIECGEDLPETAQQGQNKTASPAEPGIKFPGRFSWPEKK